MSDFDITIPPEAWRAAMSTYHKMIRKDPGDAWQAALRAAIAAWPGHHIHEWQRPWLGGMNGTDLILPLQEPSDE